MGHNASRVPARTEKDFSAMKQVVIVAIGVIIGFALGWVARPLAHGGPVALTGTAPAIAARPSDGEATEAVRRNRKFLGPSQVTIKISECVATGAAPGVRCTTQLFDEPGGAAKPHVYDFALINGRWEVAG